VHVSYKAAVVSAIVTVGLFDATASGGLLGTGSGEPRPRGRMVSVELSQHEEWCNRRRAGKIESDFFTAVFTTVYHEASKVHEGREAF